MLFAGFAAKRIRTPETEIHLLQGGSGPPVLLLHGYPQTHACWHRVAPRLAERFTVICPDLRGYGDSGKPPSGTDHVGYSKRAMAAELVAVMAALGHERFAVAGHDRGARVAYRMALDHPDRVARLAVLDIIPTIETWARLDRIAGLTTYHWYFLAQPRDFPERLIGADPDYFLDHTLRSWSGRPDAFDAEALAEYRRCFRDPAVIHATCEDYRAGATIDVAIDEADRGRRRIACPVLALWGEVNIGKDMSIVLELWRDWADDVRGQPIAGGHFLPEEAPDETTAALAAFFAG
ncbi:MAG: alpha/beta fold hydrolase [Dongiaceae bacterium]